MNLSLEIANKSLMTSQSAISIAMHNIANAGTDGYSEEKVKTEPSLSVYDSASGQNVGSGANIVSIERQRDGFLDAQYRDNNSEYSYNEEVYNCLNEIESMVGNASGSNIKAAFNNFWNNLEKLSDNPSNPEVRENLKQSATEFTSSFRSLSGNISKAKSEYTTQVGNKINEANDLLENINNINDEITRLSVNGNTPNDLMDKRDTMLDKLSSLMDIEVINSKYNSVSVISNGNVVIQPGLMQKLTENVSTDGTVDIKWSDGATFDSKNGSISAMKYMVNDKIPEYLNKLNTLAKDYITAFNTQHRNGYGTDGSTGIDFFKGDSALNIDISDDIKNDVNKIAASATGDAGNNENISALSDLQNNKIIDSNTFSPGDYLNNAIIAIATDTSTSKSLMDSSENMTDEIDTNRKNVYGVSIDEEISSIINNEHVFEASGKIIKMVDDMYESLLNSI